MMNKSNSEHNNTSNTLSNIDKLKELRKIHINTIKKTQDQMKKNKEMKNSLYINYYKDKRNNQSPKPIKTKLSKSSLGTYYKTQPNNLNQSKAHYSTNVTDPDNKTKSNDNKVHSLYLNNENNDQPNKLDIEKPKMSIIKNSMSKIQTNRVSNLSKKIDSVNLNTSYKSKDQSPNKTNNVQNQSYSNIKLNKYSSANFSVTDKYNNDYDSRIELMKKENLKSKLKQLQEEDRRTKAFRYIISKKEREQYMKTKEKIRKIKAKETMQVKNYNLLIKENVEILKEKINEENKQKRIIVQSKDEIIKKAIEQYLEKKQEFINHMCLQDLKKQRIIFKQIKNNTTAENKSY